MLRFRGQTERLALLCLELLVLSARKGAQRSALMALHYLAVLVRDAALATMTGPALTAVESFQFVDPLEELLAVAVVGLLDQTIEGIFLVRVAFDPATLCPILDFLSTLVEELV